jgi:myo-inositol 2-dehydrogenase/D-chiro-inositol 1-dehydrogenase
MGQQAVYGELAKFGDCDNGWGMVEFANGKVLTTHLGRTLTNGYEATTRLCGTKAHTIINSDCRLNGVEIRDSYGVRTLTTPDAFALHDKSFLNDIAEFADAVLDNKPLTCAPEDAYEAAKIATALQYSFRNGVPVFFDDEGMPIMQARNGKVNGTNGTNGKLNGINGINGH